MVVVIIHVLVVQQFTQLVLSDLQNACQSADWHAFCGSSVCGTQSADCAYSQIVRNIYICSQTKSKTQRSDAYVGLLCGSK